MTGFPIPGIARALRNIAMRATPQTAIVEGLSGPQLENTTAIESKCRNPVVQL
ncbi:MAG: hypothetical protein AAFN43_11535 [Pseudomonadota bacterium]